MLHEEVEKPTPPTSTVPKPARLIGSLRSIFDKLPSYIPALELVKKRKNEKRIGNIPKPDRLIGSLRSIFDKLPSYTPSLELVKKRKIEKRIGKIPKRFKVYEAVPTATITTKWKLWAVSFYLLKTVEKSPCANLNFLKNVQ